MKRRIVLPVLTVIAYFCLFLMAAKYDMPLSEHLTARQISAVVLTGARIGPLPVFFAPAWCLRALFPKPQKQILFRLIEAALCITCGWNLIDPEQFILSEILSSAAGTYGASKEAALAWHCHYHRSVSLGTADEMHLGAAAFYCHPAGRRFLPGMVPYCRVCLPERLLPFVSKRTYRIGGCDVLYHVSAGSLR